MSDNKYPIIANGEVYIEAIKKKNISGPKKYPRGYEEARKKVYQDLLEIEEKIKSEEEIFFEEKVVCVRLEPSFEAKSYKPLTLEITDNIEIIGGRKYRFDNDEGNEELAKLYFMRTNNLGIAELKKKLEANHETTKKWKEQISSIRNINLLSHEEKAQGFTDKWEQGEIEIVLHPLDRNPNDVIRFILDNTNIAPEHTNFRIYEDGLTFISAVCDRNDLIKLEKFNILRTIHPIGQINLNPFRMEKQAKAPKPAKEKMYSDIKVGVFDGGVTDGLDLLSPYVQINDLVTTQPTKEYLEHGIGVCGAVLYGTLNDLTSSDEVENPAVTVESFRVFPPNTITAYSSQEAVFGLYDTIDQIEKVVEKRKDLKLFNLSFGPNEPILDDNISRFTYALDRLTYKVEDDEINPLFCIAVGNDGDQGLYFNRVQTPSDMVNGLAIGSYSLNSINKKSRVYYSSVGPGREGAKVKPDVLEFGGCQQRPFITVGHINGTIGATAGTSFAAPVATGKIGKMMAHSDHISPHLGRTLLIHNAGFENNQDFRNEESGYGFSHIPVEDILHCDDKKITILYEGFLTSKRSIKLPIFLPDINTMSGNVQIKWTITTIVNPDITDTDAYTNNCIQDTFYPHSGKFDFTKGKIKKVLDLTLSESIEQAEQLVSEGYSQSYTPKSDSPKNKKENELRNVDLKWDTVIKKRISKNSKSLYEPYLTLQAIGRNGFETEDIKYFVAVTVEAPKYEGSLYDSIFQTYPSLLPLELRNVNDIMIPVE